jgi:probable F420-dependent oxidoreductase
MMSIYPLVGIGLPIGGPHAGPAAIREVARAADRLGFHSVSLSERILLPGDASWSNDFGLPQWPFYDAIESLTWVSAQTSRVRLRTDILVPLFQQPVVLARRLATLDHLSEGRIEVGVARGWLPAEFVATGVRFADKGAAFEESVAAMRACWAPDPVEFEGDCYRIPLSRIGPKPIQDPIPLYVGGLAPSAIQRAARIGDGFTIGFRSWAASLEEATTYREFGGTGPIVFRAGPMLADAEYATPPTTWTEPSIADDLARAAAEGIHQVIWDLNIVETPPADQIRALESLATKIY